MMMEDLPGICIALMFVWLGRQAIAVRPHVGGTFWSDVRRKADDADP